MKKNLLFIFSIGILAMMLAGSTFAQVEDRRAISAASSLYVVSVEAGGVNYIEGKVEVERKTGENRSLVKGDELEIGDKVLTAENGRAEILLNPGSFMRLDKSSNFEFLTTSLDNLQIQLNGGSAMFEIITDNEFTVAVNTPKAKFNIVKSGVYRIDVLADGAGKIEVWKGEALLNDADKTQVKSGRQATVKDNQSSVIKFDRDEKDALEAWSKTRAKELSKVNARLERSRTDGYGLRNTLVNSFYNNQWNLFNSFGIWVYNPMYGSFCFLPFGYGWSSPYGYFYPRDIWDFNLPRMIYNQGPPVRTPRGVTASGTRQETEKPRTNGKRDAPAEITPPYKRVQREIGQTPRQPVELAPFPAPIPLEPSRSNIPVMIPTEPSKRGN